ncbi:hypothetical protein ACVWWR_001231 [Bradyrhizobium sp. LM3.2]
MLLIGLGALLVLGGILYMARATIWRGSLSRARWRYTGADAARRGIPGDRSELAGHSPYGNRCRSVGGGGRPLASAIRRAAALDDKLVSTLQPMARGSSGVLEAIEVRAVFSNHEQSPIQAIGFRVVVFNLDGDNELPAGNVPDLLKSDQFEIGLGHQRSCHRSPPGRPNAASIATRLLYENGPLDHVSGLFLSLLFPFHLRVIHGRPRVSRTRAARCPLTAGRGWRIAAAPRSRTCASAVP